MATLKLHREECRERFLPMKCMRCGAPAEDLVQKQFSWSSPWWYLLLCAGVGVLIVIIIRVVLAKRMTVEIPVCPKHERHWGKCTAIIVGLLLLDVVGVFAFVAASNQNGVPDYAFFGVLAMWILSIPLMIFFAFNQIRADHIDESYITLAGVDEGFAADVAVLQLQEEEEYQSRRKAKRELNRKNDEEGPYDDD